ncbi:50S ribosomal protein L2 [Verrucomicrobiota bacterium]
MALKKYKPTTSTLRFTVVSAFDEITDSKPERSLLESKKSKAGRNSLGRITVRHRGGGHKRKYRKIDFKRDKFGIKAVVKSIQYDPNRSANIALLYYVDGEKRYIIAPFGLKVGMEVMSGPDAAPQPGNAMPISQMAVGLPIHNIELEPGRGACLVRGAGASAQLMSKGEKFANVKLPSGEIRMINIKCMATIGQVGNEEHSSTSDGKAGRKRRCGIRPTVRGVAMNPVDHPMGGGEGRTSGGGHPVSPWSTLAKSGKTRSKRRTSSKFIVKRRVKRRK